MDFWNSQAGYDTGNAIKMLAESTKRSKATKYEVPMKIKTFILKNEFTEALDKEVNDFIQDKLVIDIKMTRMDESAVTVIVMYKTVKTE